MTSLQIFVITAELSSGYTLFFLEALKTLIGSQPSSSVLPREIMARY